jgi:hypothetical protein
MNPHSIPPLLRGIGTTVVLLTTILSVIFARADLRQSVKKLSPPPAPSQTATSPASDRDISAVAEEVRELKEEVERDSVAEEVLENKWFEVFGFIGTAIVAGSFYAEWYVRRKKME